MRNLIVLKQAIRNILKEQEDASNGAQRSFPGPTTKLIEIMRKHYPDNIARYDGAIKQRSLSDNFLFNNISNLSDESEVIILQKEKSQEILKIYFELKQGAIEKEGYEIFENKAPWIGYDFTKDKLVASFRFEKKKSDEEEDFNLSPGEAAALTSVVQAAKEQGASTPNEIADQIAQDVNVSDPGGFAQAIAPVVAAAAKTGFEDADLSSLPKGSQQAAKQVAANSAKSGSSKTDTKKVIADFTREVIQGMKIQPNRKNASVVDKTLKWLKTQDKLKAESANYNRTKIRNTL